MKNAVIYARYSSHAQRDQSIADQIRDCEEYAKNHEYRIIDIYADHAISGTTDNRAEFQRMLRDSDLKGFEIVLVWKIDRFGRDRYDMAVNKRHLKRNGVQIVSVKETIPDGPEGVLIESLMEGMAEYYSKSLGQNVKRGLDSNGRRGMTTGGIVPLGYKLEDKKFVIDELAAENVRDIFDMYINGITLQEILAELKRRGVRNGRGNEFNYNNLRRLLTNRRYIGENYIKGELLGEVPAIVDRETFEKAQDMIENSGKTGTKYKTKFLLAGKIYCGKCGKLYKSSSGTSHTGKVYDYYVCTGSKSKTDKCDNRKIAKDKLEDTVLKVTLEHVLTDENILMIADRVIEILSQTCESLELQSMKSRRDELKKKQNNLFKAIEDGLYSPALKDRISEISDELEALEIEILKESAKKPLPDKEAVIWFLNRFRSLDYQTVKARRNLFNALIQSVTITDDVITIRYNFSGLSSKGSFHSSMVGESPIKLNQILIYPNYIEYSCLAA